MYVCMYVFMYITLHAGIVVSSCMQLILVDCLVVLIHTCVSSIMNMCTHYWKMVTLSISMARSLCADDMVMPPPWHCMHNIIGQEVHCCPTYEPISKRV
jgi:hypothetical protein